MGPPLARRRPADPGERRRVRHHVRTRLARAGMGSLGGGVWIAPHADREPLVAAALEAAGATDEAISFRADMGSLGRPEDVVGGLGLRASSPPSTRGFLDRFSPLRPRGGEAVFRAQTELVHAWRRIAFLDPDLPAELLPRGWPRRRAYELFHRRHAAWHAEAQEHFGSLEELARERQTRLVSPSSTGVEIPWASRMRSISVSSAPTPRELIDGRGRDGRRRATSRRVSSRCERRRVELARARARASASRPGARSAVEHAEAQRLRPELRADAKQRRRAAGSEERLVEVAVRRLEVELALRARRARPLELVPRALESRPARRRPPARATAAARRARAASASRRRPPSPPPRPRATRAPRWARRVIRPSPARVRTASRSGVGLTSHSLGELLDADRARPVPARPRRSSSAALLGPLRPGVLLDWSADPIRKICRFSETRRRRPE